MEIDKVGIAVSEYWTAMPPKVYHSDSLGINQKMIDVFFKEDAFFC